ncbi:MAG: GNAT family N-acetyltransferase [Rhizobiaceae bacterium]
MNENIQIRASEPADLQAIENLYGLAFPDEDLLPLVRDLLDDRPDVVSLVAVTNGELVAHIAFTICSLKNMPHEAALLAPLAVAPSLHGRGLGTKMAQAGLQKMKASQMAFVLVLGDPNYYGRFGFTQEKHVLPPYELPEEWASAWQSVRLKEADLESGQKLLVPEPWRKKALWAP